MKNNMHKHGGEAVYGLGFIGAAIYFINHAVSFWLGVFGLFKSHCLAGFSGI